MARTQHHLMTIGEQVKGIYYAEVLQTDVSIGIMSGSPIPTGQMTVSIKTLNSSGVYGPMPYPGKIAPPVGTLCAVGFNASNNPVALCFYGWNPGVNGTVPLAKLTTLGSAGSLTIVEGLITAFTAPS